MEDQGVADVVALLLIAHVGAAHGRHPQAQVGVSAHKLLPCVMEKTMAERPPTA